MNYGYPTLVPQQPQFPNWKFILAVVIFTIIAAFIYVNVAHAEELSSWKVIDQAIQEANTDPVLYCNASWYSIGSLKKEGTYKATKGVMANGEKFNENDFTCATRLYPLGSILRITNIATGHKCVVRVTDKIGRRFATKRIDLSKMAFSRISELKKGIISVKIERLS